MHRRDEGNRRVAGGQHTEDLAYLTGRRLDVVPQPAARRGQPAALQPRLPQEIEVGPVEVCAQLTRRPVGGELRGDLGHRGAYVGGGHSTGPSNKQNGCPAGSSITRTRS